MCKRMLLGCARRMFLIGVTILVASEWAQLQAQAVPGSLPPVSPAPVSGAPAIAIPAQPIASMGQPPRWQTYAALLGATGPAAKRSPLRIAGGVDRPIINPVTGILDATAEGYLAPGSATAWGVRGLASVRSLATAVGVDWNATAGEIDLMVSYQTAIRRGGIVGGGTMLRVDWLPTRSHEVSVGLEIPLLQPYAGRTRDRKTSVSIAPSEMVPRMSATADGNRQADDLGPLLHALAAFTNLYPTRAEQSLGAVGGRSYGAVVEEYGEMLVAAFESAAGDRSIGERAAARSREALLDGVLLPYNSLFGRPKAENGIAPLAAAAEAAFAAWVRDSAGAPPSRHAAMLVVNAGLTTAVQRLHRELLSQWKDSRFVWLPLQLALTTEQYDDQEEVDSLIQRITGRPFTDRNGLAYLNSTDLPIEIARSIFAARDYHVLWTHDFTGRRESGAIDNVGFSMMADVYLPALTEAVKRYDSTGVFPVYMILLDQFFYEPRGGRLLMTFLEDPLNARTKLPGDNADREAHLRMRQEELRSAVAASVRLQSEARATGSAEAWLRRVVKVHVNIVHPADFSFRSARIVPPFPFIPDNVMREHRKLVVYDVTEADPYRGAMILMGVGVGEHYASDTWEDRGYRMRGPAVLEVREALRKVLRANGFHERDIPPPLRSVAPIPGTEAAMNTGDYVGRALQVHNEAGFGSKASSVVRAMLYNLALPGSVIIAPDPLWLSGEWAGMLAAAAARGSEVHLIAPALANAPSPQGPLMAVQHELLRRMLDIQAKLGGGSVAGAGKLRIGLYAPRVPVSDAAGRIREVRVGLARAPWIADIIPFGPATLAVLERAEAAVAPGTADPRVLADDETFRAPQLHQKTMLVALPGALAALARQPGWEQVLSRATEVRTRHAERFAEHLAWTTPEVDSAAVLASDELLNAFEASRSEADRKRVSFYFSTGTQNQDPRGIALDGEASIIVSGYHAAAGVVDLYFLLARSEWITTEEELSRLLPRGSALMRFAGRLFRAAF